MKIIIYLIFQYGPMLKLSPVVSAISDFWLTQKHTHFVKDHQRNTPAMISVKCLKKKKKELCPVVMAFLDFFFQLKFHWKPFFFLFNIHWKTIGTHFKNHWVLLKTPLNFHLFGKIC